jgi:hypothetical protein
MPDCTLIVTFTSRHDCKGPKAFAELEAIEARAGADWTPHTMSLAADRQGLLVLSRRMPYDDARELVRTMYEPGGGELGRIHGEDGGVRAASIRHDTKEREPWEQ